MTQSSQTPDSNPPNKAGEAQTTAATNTAKAATTSAATEPSKKRKRKAAPSSSTKATRKKSKNNNSKASSSASSANNKATSAVSAAAASLLSKKHVILPPSSVLVIDNGGDTIKFGWMTDSIPKTIPNITARLQHQWTILVGDELATRVQNPASLMGITRSTERGIPCDLGNQTQVWKRLLNILNVTIPLNTEAAQSLGWKQAARSSALNKKSNKNKPIGTAVASGETTTTTATTTTPILATSCAVLLLFPPFMPRLLLDQILAIWFEDFGFSHVGLGVSSACAAMAAVAEAPTTASQNKYKTSCVVDLGWSATQIIPTFKNKPVDTKAIRRLPLGGRHLINMYKYHTSYRQYNLMDQEWILRDVLENSSYMSLNYKQELQLARYKPSGRRPYDQDYVLPDFKTTLKGRFQLPIPLQRELERKNNNDENEDDEDEEENSEDDEDFEDPTGDNDVDDIDMDDDEDDDDNDDDMDDDSENNEDDDKKSNDKSNNINKQGDQQENNNDISPPTAATEEITDENQLLRLSVERFTIPEVLFRPLDGGMLPDLVGLPTAIVQSIQACPPAYHAPLFQSITLVGGVSQLPNLVVRLEQELRSLVPCEYDLEIYKAPEPIYQAWHGGCIHVRNFKYNEWSINREEWIKSHKRMAYKRLLISSLSISEVADDKDVENGNNTNNNINILF